MKPGRIVMLQCEDPMKMAKQVTELVQELEMWKERAESANAQSQRLLTRCQALERVCRAETEARHDAEALVEAYESRIRQISSLLYGIESAVKGVQG